VLHPDKVSAFIDFRDLETSSMKWLWCWRCQKEMPMLDEAEYQAVASKRQLQASCSLKEQFADALDEFERITGFREENPNAIWHHRL
jgi:hypothetical protein